MNSLTFKMAQRITKDLMNKGDNLSQGQLAALSKLWSSEMLVKNVFRDQ